MEHLYMVITNSGVSSDRFYCTVCSKSFEIKDEDPVVETKDE
jgi:transposase-like protein